MTSTTARGTKAAEQPAADAHLQDQPGPAPVGPAVRTPAQTPADTPHDPGPAPVGPVAIPGAGTG